MNNAGELVEESYEVFRSIASATDDGRDRMRKLDVKDLTERTYGPRRGVPQRRSR